MYKRIIAAVNEFTNSEMAAKYAIAMAQACGSSLSIVFVSNDKMSRELFHRAEAATERLFTEAEKKGIEVECITETGDPAEKIKEIVIEKKAQLVFVATRHEDMKKRFFARTLARDLMVTLPCSVAMVRIVRMARMYPSDILVPIRADMSNLGERAYFIGCLAGAFNSAVTLFHLPAPMTSFFHGEIRRRPAQEFEALPEDVEIFRDYFVRQNIDNRKRIGYGSVSKGITIEAAQMRNELIVIGASERSIVRSMISGNPVEEVLRETPCNLIVLRPGHVRE